jgi:preprotein translocase subunit SecA
MHIFGSDRVAGLMQKLGLEEGVAIEHPWVSRSIENAQRKVEGRNFDIRKQLLEFDDVANEQRKFIYAQRNNLMDVEDISSGIEAIRQEVVDGLFGAHIPPQSLEEQWDVAGLEQVLENEYGVKLPIARWLQDEANLDESRLRVRVLEEFEKAHADKTKQVGESVMRHFEKAVMLQVLDTQWKDHLAAMDYLRQGIHLRGYAQKNPKEEYKRESFTLFADMLERIKREVISLVTRVQIRQEQDVEALEASRKHEQNMVYEHPSVATDAAPAEASAPEAPRPLRVGPKTGRNSPCPCGSGKKYKQCHGKLA